MGGWQQGRGGDAVRLDQLGDRHGVVVRLPPMKFDDPVTARHGRLWISSLKRGMSEGARVRFIQPDYTPPLTSANLTTTAARATLIAVSGSTPNGPLPEGTGSPINKAATASPNFHN